MQKYSSYNVFKNAYGKYYQIIQLKNFCNKISPLNVIYSKTRCETMIF
jgi:hypothetical protein